ncbi:hypothetical protein GOBAR_AA29289 [Gossypium barbadense]|uniref:DUF4283 domain-containing protein n=1 Tax=Gossypium barbadense TaxID=3634 RepID=A0A2P5WK18_GOSBA|nr:hypothetical protein GOBAR_AA29289 [Gossypium barbadense]
MIPKKVRFRDKEEETSNDMVIELSSDLPTSWKERLVGHSSKKGFNGSEEKEAIDILEGDIQRSMVNGMSSIMFSDRIHQILLQGMDNTVILKLLGRNIGFSILQNKIYSMWRPIATIHMMDIENDYFLVKFQNKLDYEKVLSEGPWTIFGQYFTVQPWTMAFDSTQAYPSVVMAWIKFPALPSYLYNHKIITEIRELVGKVVKLDMNTDSKANGKFSRMAVYGHVDNICKFKTYESTVEANSCKFKTSESTVEANRDSPVTESESQKGQTKVQRGTVGAGSSGRTLAVVFSFEQVIVEEDLQAAKEHEIHRSNSPSKELDRGEVVVDVGSLDSGRYSAVVFLENKEHLPTSSSSAPLGNFDSGKGMRIRGKNSKQNKSLHGSNVCFKNHGSHRVSLRKSMELLAENISAITEDNVEFEMLTGNVEQMEGLNIPRQ